MKRNYLSKKRSRKRRYRNKTYRKYSKKRKRNTRKKLKGGGGGGFIKDPRLQMGTLATIGVGGLALGAEPVEFAGAGALTALAGRLGTHYYSKKSEKNPFDSSLKLEEITAGLENVEELIVVKDGRDAEGLPALNKTVFAAEFHGKPIILKIYSERTYHPSMLENLEEFKKEFEMMKKLETHGIALKSNGLFSITFGDFQSKLKAGYKLPPPIKFHGGKGDTKDRPNLHKLEEIPLGEVIHFYIMEKCDEFKFNQDNIIQDLIDLFTIMNIMVSKGLKHDDIQLGNIVRCNGVIKLIDPLYSGELTPQEEFLMLENSRNQDLKDLRDHVVKRCNPNIAIPHEPGFLVKNDLEDGYVVCVDVEALFKFIGLNHYNDYESAITKLKELKRNKFVIVSMIVPKEKRSKHKRGTILKEGPESSSPLLSFDLPPKGKSESESLKDVQAEIKRLKAEVHNEEWV